MNEILQPLRTYSSVDELLPERHNLLGYRNFVPVIADRTHLLPFSIVCDKTNTTQNLITTCKAVNYNTNQEYDILSQMKFSFLFDNTSAPTKMYVVYLGDATITSLPQGIYYLRIISTDFTRYVGPFKIGFYDKICTLEYRHSLTFSNIHFYTDVYYKATFEGYTYDSGDFDVYSEDFQDINNHPVNVFKRKDKLRSLAINGDSNMLDFLHIAEMCDDVYITDELGIKIKIKIHEINPSPINQSNYLAINLKYRVIDNAIISSDTQTVNLIYQQEGASIVTPETDGITFNGETITFNGEPVKFNE